MERYHRRWKRDYAKTLTHAQLWAGLIGFTHWVNGLGLPQIEDVGSRQGVLKSEQGWRVDTTLQFWIVA